MEIGKVIDKVAYYTARATGDYVYDAKRLLEDLDKGKKTAEEIWDILSIMYDHKPTGRASKIASYILNHASDDEIKKLSAGIKTLKIALKSPVDEEKLEIIISVEGGG